MNSKYYNEDYYENGIITGKSLYTNYRYIPEKVLPIAKWLLNEYEGLSFLDYGCAKGFLVKAIRELGGEAYGYDISEYSIKNCEIEVKDYVSNNILPADIVVCKDVLEHIEEHNLNECLFELKKYSKGVFLIPIGENGKYIIEEYSHDMSHFIAENCNWWLNKFSEHNINIVKHSFDVSIWKPNWYNVNPLGNCLFFMEN